MSSTCEGLDSINARVMGLPYSSSLTARRAYRQKRNIPAAFSTYDRCSQEFVVVVFCNIY